MMITHSTMPSPQLVRTPAHPSRPRSPRICNSTNLLSILRLLSTRAYTHDRKDLDCRLSAPLLRNMNRHIAILRSGSLGAAADVAAHSCSTDGLSVANAEASARAVATAVARAFASVLGGCTTEGNGYACVENDGWIQTVASATAEAVRHPENYCSCM